jgi:hypothetical protein
MNDFSSSFLMLVGCAFLLFYCVRTLVMSAINVYKETVIRIHLACKEIKDVKDDCHAQDSFNVRQPTTE